MDIKWIKLATNIFDNKKIKQIETLPDGDSIIVIWFKLLALAGSVNDNGFVYFTKDIPYTDQMLAAYFNRPLTTIQMAISIFEKYGMIEIVDNVIFVSNWEKYQNVEGMERIREQTRKRVAKHRELKKLECNVTGNVTVTQSNATDIDIDIDIDKRKDIPKGISKRKCFTPPTVDEVRAYCQERGNNIDPQRFVDFYESKGWFVGKNKMKDWKAAVRNWEGRDKQNTPKQSNAETWGAKIYDLSNEQNYPFFGFPEEWFDGHDLNESRVTPVIHPIDKQRGIYDKFMIKPQELIDLYKLRRDYYEQRK